MESKNEFVALMSLDWADQSHQGCLQAAGCDVEEFRLQQKPSEIQEWAGKLRARFKGGKIAVAIEQKRGPLIYALMKYELFVIFPLNTTAVKNYRKALRASGAKDDCSDARLQLLFLRNHMGQLRRMEPDRKLTRQLRMFVEARRKMVDGATAVSNQITALLKEYYPAALDLVGDIKTSLACDLLGKWPCLEAIKRVRPEELRDFYYKRNCRSKEAVERRIRLIYEAVALIDEKPILAAYCVILRSLVHQLRALLKEINSFDRRIEKIFSLHPDISFYKSLPAAGAALEPRLAVVFGDDRNKFDSAVAVSNFTGISPVTHQSGKKKTVVFRLAAPKFARQSLIEFAAHTITKSTWAASYYRKCRQEGKSHNAAVRALAFKWIRILYRCWKNRVPYDETIYLDALKRKNVPWLTFTNAG
jgi:transposase